MEIQRKEAIKRIEQKIDILENWLNSEIPFSLTSKNTRVLNKNGGFELEYFPTSISGLRNWNGSKNNPDIINKYNIPTQMTSTTTWDATPTYIKECVTGTKKINSIFIRLKEKALIQRDSGRISKVKELEATVTLVKKNHVAIAHEMLGLRLENDTLTAEVYIAEQKLEGLKSQHKVEIEWRNKAAIQQKSQILELEKKNLILQKQLLKISKESGIYPEKLTLKTNVVPFDLGDK
ncbi:hypothetical protein H4J50_10185 [Colwellia sp. 6M3]|jgi:hypothetical protein|uniref:hypothetical protein n=1 Tax=Colwellia sp. 6M3 TaxID=2759849 RepID=UPI0015F415CD|nr:hypothetical protein [Colwellia sp. 6M3]MBA6416383.1 hypothetical protein [Colwellia sp. 6M3]